MQQGGVYFNGINAGTLSRLDSGVFAFEYTDDYFNSPSMPAISLTLPKTKKKHESNTLFPFFYGLLTEGINKEMQCRLLKIDENDDFTRLLKTASSDTIGAITIKEEI